MERRSPIHRSAFTLIELLLVIGIIAVLAGIVFLSVNPTRQLAQAKDAKRGSDVKQLQNALTQYYIDNSALPTTVVATEARPICKQGVSADTTCSNLDVLTPTYIATLPQDDSEKNTNYSGYKVYVVSNRPQVSSVYQGLITANLIANWRFEEKTGTTVADSAGTYPGTLYDASTVGWSLDSPGVSKSTGSFNFYDSGDYILLSTTEAPLGSAWTVTTWFKAPFTTGVGWHTLLRGSVIDHQIILNAANNNLGMYANGAAGFYDSGYNPGGLPAGWHHLAAVGQGSATSFYIDGSFVGASAYKSVAPIYAIGNLQGGGQVWGQIADLRVYSRILTPGEILKIAQGGG